ncbi:hypothetical protein [Gulosibacter massiliensis]|uniref:hypothetical protein n=1 Tax=Gulosibacter massiliensis TaxID=2479839 RepID=UPI000F63B73D|nr:hypothetical protein [Gulosibacter massiliensis]
MVASIGLMFAVAVTGCTATGDSGVDGDPVTNVDATESVDAAETAAPSESAEPEELEEPSATTGLAESEDADELEPAAVNGRWCAAADSPTDEGCITIEWPNVAFDSGTPSLTISVVDEDSDGCVVLSQGDAPFGTYCGAGIELRVPAENFTGSDYPSEDRIWGSQTGWMYLRE